MGETNRTISKRHIGAKKTPEYGLGFLLYTWSVCARRTSVRW